jgi:FkbH-like protein
MSRCVVISDFNAENFAGYLSQEPAPPALEAHAAPFGQVAQVLMDAGHACWSPRPDIVIVWTQPQAVSEAFGRLLDGELVDPARVIEDVDHYAERLIGIAGRTGCVLVPSWVLPAHHSPVMLVELQHNTGSANALMRMNLRLAERLAEAPGVHLLNAERWIQAAGPRAANPKLWYMAKIPFGPEVFQAAVKDTKAALAGLSGQSRKLILLDLDDTLWGGLVGEIGWEHLTLGGHDQAGEAFADFQRALKALAARGILLGIVSKNDEAVALEAIRQHPEMVLRQEDFAGWRINWNDKAQNVAELVEELNLGLQSVVFIDDHPVERARVREALPEVLVPEWPSDPMLYRKALMSLGCFERSSVSREDRERTRLYVTERHRSELKSQVGSLDDWLKTLGLTVTFDPLIEANLARATQLLNKTNQMNLSTRRLSESELMIWAAHPQRTLWTVHVADRFGPSGLTGLVSMELNGAGARIVDFVLSCRVMGRKVEEAMVATAVQEARLRGLASVVARYVPTERNRPCLEFWEQRSGFTAGDAARTFHWDARRAYPFPPHVRIEGALLEPIERA